MAGKIWAEIDLRSRPSAAIGADLSRPQLACAFIEHRDDQLLLCATDSYLLAEIPIRLSLPKERWGEVAPEVALIPEAVRALDSAARFRIKDGLLEIDGRAALYPVKTDVQPPAFKQLWPEKLSEEGLPEIAFDPSLLKRLTEAIGAPGGIGNTSGVKLKFTTPLRPILVEPLNQNGSRGLLMPVRAS